MFLDKHSTKDDFPLNFKDIWQTTQRLDGWSLSLGLIILSQPTDLLAAQTFRSGSVDFP